MRRILRILTGSAFALAGLGIVSFIVAAEKPAAKKSAAAAQAPAAETKGLSPEAARREVRMLDDLYKSAIIYINDTYVEDENSVAAGETFRDLFTAMREKGWHHARLIDGTGEPLNEENKPQGEFETTAIAKILAGEPYYDQVVREDGHKYLRAATVVPVINAKCVMCHPGNKIGDVLGAVSYKIQLE